MDMVVSSLFAVLGSPSLLQLIGVASLAGVVAGVVPGLGGKVALAILIPITFGMDPIAGAVLLVAMHAAVSTGSAIPSILLGIPGTGASAATVVDGFPMTQQGQAGRAIGASLGASGLGGIIGAVILAFLAPIAAPLVLIFGPAEIFSLTVLGITFVASLSGRYLVRGLIVGALGLMVSFVGMDPQTGAQRYTFGQLFLWDGVDLITAMLAVFAIPEIIAMGLRHGAVSLVNQRRAGYGAMQVLAGVLDSFRHLWLIVRASFIGAVIGLIPGLGGSVASWLAYGHAVQSSQSPEEFGKGAVAGVIAPEAANNSKEGGALLPTLLFGIPGSSGMAVLLGGFIALGIIPGPQLVSGPQPIIWTLIWTLVIANLFAVLLFLVAARWLGLASFVDVRVLIPFAIVFCLLGSWLSSAATQNMLLMLVLGALGYGLKRTGWPIPPFAVGLVLGRTSELSLHRSLAIWGAEAFLRPITLVLLGLALASVVIYVIRFRSRKEQIPSSRADLLLSAGLLALFTFTSLAALEYPPQSRLLPLVVGIPAVALCIAETVRLLRSLPAFERSTWRITDEAPRIRRELVMLGWLLLIVGTVLVVGFAAGLAISVVAFLRVEQNATLGKAFFIAGISSIVLYLSLTQLLGLTLYSGLIAKLLPGQLF